MRTYSSVLKCVSVALALFMLVCFVSRGQFLDCSTGLMQAPSAEVNQTGTFMLTGTFLNKHTTSDFYWGYHTYGYGINITLFKRLELGYVCALLNGKKKPGEISDYYRIMVNQDRHFTAKLLLFQENEFGTTWLPAIAIGVSDPTSGAISYDDYVDSAIAGEGGYFNRYYVVATKHFLTRFGDIGAHLGYQYNLRKDIHFNGPCAAIDWMPIWLQKENVVATRLIAEYDARTFNIGAIVSLWRDHFEAMVELQAMKWISAGIRYKLVLKS